MLDTSLLQKPENPQAYPVQEIKYPLLSEASDFFNERPYKEGGKRLGSGSFGTVYHGILRLEDGNFYEAAIKRLKKVPLVFLTLL